MAVTWITVEEVKVALGIDPATDTDDAYLETVTDAAQEWAFDVRAANGYVDDPEEVPSTRVAMGTILYAVTLYRERGSVDSYASFQEMPNPAPFGQDRQIRRLLGLPRQRVA